MDTVSPKAVSSSRLRLSLLGATALASSLGALAFVPALAQSTAPSITQSFTQGDDFQSALSVGTNGVSGVSRNFSDDTFPTPGGAGGSQTLTLYGTAGGPPVPALPFMAGVSAGGAGGAAFEQCTFCSTPSTGQDGAGGGDIMVTSTIGVSLNAVASHSLDTDVGTFDVPGVVSFISNGGAGGDGAGWSELVNGQFPATESGSGGDAGSITVNLNASGTGNSSIRGTLTETASGGSPSADGLYLEAVGGNGGNGQFANAFPAFGGEAGDGGDITVNANAVDISTAGLSAAGIYALSAGGDGGSGGNATGGEFGSAGGFGNFGGQGGTVQITIASPSTVRTSGRESPGILAESNGGPGGAAGIGSTGGGASTSAGTSYGGGSVTIHNSGSVATHASQSQGIVAQSFGGTGGAGAPGVGFIVAGGTAGGSGGDAGSVTVENKSAGTVKTSGAASVGLLAQTVAGGGGNGGVAEAIVSIGGDGGAEGNAGPTTVRNAGSVTTGFVPDGETRGDTTGAGAHGIVALSTGGGGGYAIGADATEIADGSGGGSGGSATAIFYGGGGEAGAGGSGNTVNVDQTGSVTTSGSNAHGVLAMSVGGGGGVGGGSWAAAPFVAVSVGGNGGSGGNGGAVNINPGVKSAPAKPVGSITTNEVGSYGIYAASVGGGGGDGGGSYGRGIGIPVEGVSIGVSVSVGGKGAGGGTGGSVTVNNINTVTTLDDDSFGIYAHSVGGGGGAGGAATAYANAPSANADDIVSISAAIGVGGSGGAGAHGGDVTVNNYAPIETSGILSTGLFAQSIGGGGGHGGNSLAHASTLGLGTGDGINGSLDVSVGGSGGVGGDGDNVTVLNTASITTGAASADALVAQSVGGGGGSGGSGASSSVGSNASEARNSSLTVTVGGGGAIGGKAGTVKVTNSGAITTHGVDSRAIVAHAVGGGGGHGGGTTGNAAATALTANVTVGATGGAGGDGGKVTVENDGGGDIVTHGHGGTGITAQSIGGGGGTGGSATSSNTQSDLGKARNYARYYQKLQAFQEGGISDALKAGKQSKGKSLTVNVTVGGNGGAAGDGEAVHVTNKASITTHGDLANAILAQSIGGGGGVGGSTSGRGASVGGGVTVGANGGGGGTGHEVHVTNSAALNTSGNFSMGVLAQSVGGGGGVSSHSADTTAGTVSALKVTVGGNAGNASNAGDVTIENTGDVTTAGHFAYALAGQSVGGGGGSHFLNGQSFDDDGVASTVKAPLYAAPGTPSASGAAGSSEGLGLTFAFGGDGSAGGDGGAVHVTNSATLTTSGDEAFGIFAQSVGGGGGTAGSAMSSIPAFSGTFGGDGGAGGNGGAVTVTLDDGSSINTSGTGASAVVAQSVGGSGGHQGGAVTLFLPFGDSLGDDGVAGDTGAVKVRTADTASASISTTGVGAHGIFAQSSAGTGGSYGTYAGMLSATNWATAVGFAGPDETVSGGAVTVDYTGTISATGKNAVGIYAELLEADGGNGRNRNAISITTNGDITGGSGASGAGIAIAGGVGNTITIEGGTVKAGRGGVAIASVLPGIGGSANGTSVINNGTVIGDVSLDYGGNSFTNNGTFLPGEIVTISGAPTWGTLFAQAVIQPQTYGNDADQAFSNASAPDGAKDRFINNGFLNVAGRGTVGTTTMTVSDFTQSAAGTLGVDVDYASGAADTLALSGRAELNGAIAPNITALPNTIAKDGRLGAVTFLTASDLSGVSSVDVTNTIAAAFELVEARNSIGVSATLSFDNANIQTGDAKSIAQHFDAVIATGDLGTLAPGLAALTQVPLGSQKAYETALSGLSGDGGTAATSSTSHLRAGAMHDKLHSCPVFEGETALLTEESCVYGEVIGGYGEGGNDGRSTSFSTSFASAVIGGQKAIDDTYFLGGLIGYGQSWTDGRGGSFSSDSDDLTVGVVGKMRFAKRWQAAISASYAYSSVDNRRVVNSPLVPAGTVATSTPDAHTFGLRGQLAYFADHGTLYAKPAVDLDARYVNVPGYAETGAGAFNLRYSDLDDFSVGVTPTLEIGQRVALPEATMRLFAKAGVALWSDRDFSQDVLFQGSPSGLQGFEAASTDSDVLMLGSVGAQIRSDDGFALQGKYTLQTDGEDFDHAFSARVGLRF